ncbi:MAG: hypothetical protein IJZ82_11465 [Lachnospiraceae bacterium]|nr:hypothetical protein [Lachnospiraceae bacterium]
MVWSKKKTQVMDERIEKESNGLASKLFYVQTMLVALLLVAKLLAKLSWKAYLLEMICLVVGGGFVLISEIRKGIFLLKDKDAALTGIHEGVLAKGYSLEMALLLFGELVFMYTLPEYRTWLIGYFGAWVVPALVFTVVSVKKGWIQWGSKKRQLEGKQNLKKRVAIGAFAFGILMIPSQLPMWLVDGTVTFMEILIVPLEMVLFGVLFYIMFTRMVDKGEKRANSDVPTESEEMSIEE